MPFDQLQRLKAVFEQHRFALQNNHRLEEVIEKTSSLYGVDDTALKVYLESALGGTLGQEVFLEIQQVDEGKQNTLESINHDVSSVGSSSVDLESGSDEDNQNKVSRPPRQPVKLQKPIEHKRKAYESLHNKDIDSMTVEDMRRILKQYKELNMVPLDDIPPPPTSKPPTSRGNKHQAVNYSQKREWAPIPTPVGPQAETHKERKNCLYVKNLPSYYNTADALRSYFKKFGAIRQIHNQIDKETACIVFFKDSDALRAKQSYQKIFSKPWIFKTLDPNEEPPKRPPVQEIKRPESSYQQTRRAQKYKQDLLGILSQRFNTMATLSILYKGDKVQLRNDLEQCETQEKSLKAMNTTQIIQFHNSQTFNNDYALTFSVSGCNLGDKELTCLLEEHVKQGKVLLSVIETGFKVTLPDISSILKAVPSLEAQGASVKFDSEKTQFYVDQIRTKQVQSVINIGPKMIHHMNLSSIRL